MTEYPANGARKESHPDREETVAVLVATLVHAVQSPDNERNAMLERAWHDLETILRQSLKRNPDDTGEASPSYWVCEPQAGFEVEHGKAADAAFPPVAVLEGQDVQDLNSRQKQIVELLTSGKVFRAIARQLDIAEATVKVHIKTILPRLGPKNRTILALCTIRQRWR